MGAPTNNIDEQDITLTADLSHEGVWGAAEIFDTVLKGGTLNEAVEYGLTLPPPCQLFGNLWLEGQRCILFSDNGIGKSILAMQIAQSIASGTPIPHFGMTAKAQKVLYFDFEMSERQLAMRYSDDNRQPFRFSDNLIRYYMDSSATMMTEGIGEVNVMEAGENVGHLMLMAMERVIKKHEAKVVVIDNLTAICKASAEADEALSFLSEIDRIKKDNGLSTLIVAHTPKIEPWMPLTKNDLGGSKQLSNFIDTLIGIGRCKGVRSQRYIKQLKARDTEEEYGENNIIVCELKKDGAMLQFEYVNTNTEHNVLVGAKTYTAEEREKYHQDASEGIDRERPYTREELLSLLVENDKKRGSDKQKQERARKKLQRSPHVLKDGDTYYINPEKLLKAR